ncbi:MAG: hypothetical protein JXA46_06270 [Dehalococcoidales bacterium]|nr:hypothetical protein [Dehalococcoidales bacterium]
MEKFAFNMIPMSSISSSILFRLIQNLRASLAVDEAETLFSTKDPASAEITKILNSGYKKGALVYRSVKDSSGDFKPKGFEVYSPKAIASIRDLGDMLESRCIPINMLRSSSSNQSNLIITDNCEQWAKTRSDLYCLALIHFQEIRQIYETDTSIQILKNRDNELWLPLFSIAKFFDQLGVSNLLEKVTTYAESNVRDNSGSSISELEEIFLKSLVILYKNGNNEVSSIQVRDEMYKTLEEDRRDTLNTQRIGYFFKNFGLLGSKEFRKRKSGGMVYRLDTIISKVRDVMNRYGIESEAIQSNFWEIEISEKQKEYSLAKTNVSGNLNYSVPNEQDVMKTIEAYDKQFG